MKVYMYERVNVRKYEIVNVRNCECEKVWRAHGEDLGLPEQVVAVAADVEQAAMGSWIVEASAGQVQRNFGDLMEIGSFFSSSSSD